MQNFLQRVKRETEGDAVHRDSPAEGAGETLPHRESRTSASEEEEEEEEESGGGAENEEEEAGPVPPPSTELDTSTKLRPPAPLHVFTRTDDDDEEEEDEDGGRVLVPLDVPDFLIPDPPENQSHPGEFCSGTSQPHYHSLLPLSHSSQSSPSCLPPSFTLPSL